jgi:hypothetical protein
MYGNKYAELKEKADNFHSRWNKWLVTGHSFKTDCFSGGRRNISIGNQRWNTQKSFYESPRLLSSGFLQLWMLPVLDSGFLFTKAESEDWFTFLYVVYISIQAFYFVFIED